MVVASWDRGNKDSHGSCDERAELRQEVMEGEKGSDLLVEGSGVVGSGDSGSAHPGPRSQSSKMAKKGRKRELSPSARADGGGESDDEEQPIGCLFKIKKTRVGKKDKLLSNEVRVAENPRDDDEVVDSGEMEYTLASFRKKLRGPKRVKGAQGAGSGSGKDSSSMDEISMLEKVKDIKGNDVPLKQVRKSRGRRSRCASNENDKGVSGFRVSSDNSLDVSLEDSLSAFVKKVHSGVGRRSHSASKKMGTVESTENIDGSVKQNANKVSLNLSLENAGRSNSLNDGLCLPSDGAEQGLVTKRRGRKPQSGLISEMEVSSRINEHLGGNSSVEVVEEKQTLSSGINFSSLHQSRSVPSPTSVKESSHSCGGIVNRHPVSDQEPASISAPKVVENQVSGGTSEYIGVSLDNSASSLVQTSSFNIVPEPNERSKSQEHELDRCIGDENKCSQISYGVTDVKQCHNVDDGTVMVEDAPAQYPEGKTNLMAYDDVGLLTLDHVSSWKNGGGIKQCSFQLDDSPFKSGGDKSSDIALVLVQDSCCIQAPKNSDKCEEHSNVLKGNSSPEKQGLDFSEPLTNDRMIDPCDTSLGEDTIMASCCQNTTSEEAFERLSLSSRMDRRDAVECKGNGEALPCHTETIEQRLPSSLCGKSQPSETVEKHSKLHQTGRSCEADDAPLCSSLPNSVKKEEVHTFGVCLNQPCKDIPKPLSSELSPIFTQIKENPNSNDVITKALSSNTSEGATLSHSPSSMNANDGSPEHFVQGISSGNELLQDVSEAPSSANSEVPFIIKHGEANTSDTIFNQKSQNRREPSVISEQDTGDNQSAVMRVNRNVKRRKHDDMAYEGDVDWEALIQDQGSFPNVSSGDKSGGTKDKPHSNSSNGVSDGAVAAVAAGLKARAVSLIEKIKFRDVLKRKGGLQEYLDCRNFILCSWAKDVKRILPLLSCGVRDDCLKDVSREALIHEIYLFLDCNGYINTGIASEQRQSSVPCSVPHFEIAESRRKETFMVGTTILEEKVASVEGVKVLEDAIEVKKDEFVGVHQAAGNLETEGCESKSLQVPSARLEPSFSMQVKEETVCNLELDMQSALSRHDTKLSKSCTAENVESYGPYNPTVHLNTTKKEEIVESYGAVTDSEHNIFDCGLHVVSLKQMEASSDLDQPAKAERGNIAHAQHARVNSNHLQLLEVSDNTDSQTNIHQNIIVVGAGPAGLNAARHLKRQGFSVTVLEARDRIGGRVYTDRTSLSVPVDLGASIITGVEADVATERRPDPSSLICTQLGLELTVLNSDCPLYDIVTGNKVPTDLDEALEAEFNSLLDDMLLLVSQNGESAMRMSLEDGLEYALRRRRIAQATPSDAEFHQLNMSNDSGKTDASTDQLKASGFADDAHSDCNISILSPLERRMMDWHFANLEYGCAASLKEVSLPNWNQDDVYGGFGGAHCMIKGGYDTVIESLGKNLDIRLNQIVTDIIYNLDELGGAGQSKSKVKVITSSGSEFVADAVLITVPLGCLKADTIKFSPPLPDWKRVSIQRLGFGVLNKVVLEFPKVFWDENVDYFGATAEETDRRGQCFMFWNVKKTVGAPVLIALVVGKAAREGQTMRKSDHVNYALVVLRKLFGEASVPDPVASVVTNWGMDRFSRGAYSYVAVGASGEDYDILGRPIDNCLFFAGEATCKEHPDTVGGAMISGLREAVRIIDILRTGKDYLAEVETMKAVHRKSDSERNEVRYLSKRLDACRLSTVRANNSSDGTHTLPTKESLLQDMFFSAKTVSGRLHLAKELLRLPVDSLKSFTGTKDGLSTLNKWILDSLGTNATQLLRHCVRLLVLVSTDLLAVRASGIGRTVKEKVCVHTSRDIRSIASQLVSIWIEVFRKEKALNGRLKLLRQPTASEPSKVRSRDLVTGKPPLRTSIEASESKGNLQATSSVGGSYSSSKVNNKKAEITMSNSLRAQSMVHAESKVEDNSAMSEEEALAFAAAEAARAAALKAAEVYASSEAAASALRELPKIPSFHKFARREHYAQLDEFDLRRKYSGALGRQDCTSEIDSRNCRVRNWSVDFTATCNNLESSKMSFDNYTQHSYSNEIAHPSSLKEHSGESGAIDSRLTKAWVDTDTAGSGGVKDSLAIERWQSQAMDADAEFYRNMYIGDEEDSTKMPVLPTLRHQSQTGGSIASQGAENKSSVEGQPRGLHHIKQGVVDYVASLLMPLYRNKKIDREGYKSIMKKTATKVMEQCTEAEKVMVVYDFLDSKRKNKIRAFVDKLIERHMAMNRNVKS